MDLLWYAPYALPLLLLYGNAVLKRRRRERENRAVLEESREAGLMSPASLHPVIDTSICVGCEACVHACPEYPKHKVLGIIRGKAGLVSPSDCIGHGACKTACPVGAISLVFGTKERGVDIPLVSATFESNVPGIYIAGELGGMGLIRNAIEQGRQAMEAIIAGMQGEGPEGSLDVAIIGAGPAGLSATLAAHEKGLRYVTIEQNALGGTVANFPRGKLVMTAPARLAIVGEVKFAETQKEALIEFWKEVEFTTGINIHYRERMVDLAPSEGGFLLETTKNSYRVRTVLLSLGRRGTPRLLDVPGEDLPKVVYVLIDPAQYAGKRVLVVGGGDSALEAAHSIADQPGASVTLSYRGASFGRAKRKNRDKVAEYSADQRIELLFESTVSAIEASSVTLNHAGGERVIPNDVVIVCAGGILPTGFLQDVGIQVETKYGQM
jgi:thioredoxin reductase/NAD-dependent dihydropyrimidine dehydrogenase PreA subunit